MTNGNCKFKVKLGDKEFEVEGDKEFVEKATNDWKDLLTKTSSHVDREKDSKPGKQHQKHKKSRKSSKGEGTKELLEELKGENFFEGPKNTKKILKELSKRGHHFEDSDLTWPLQQLTKAKTLSREKMELPEGGKKVWHYSNQ